VVSLVVTADNSDYVDEYNEHDNECTLSCALERQPDCAIA
jgi:hypothetical protein